MSVDALPSISQGHNRNPSATKLRWCTPRALFDAVDRRYGFGLDAAAEPATALCVNYLSRGGDDCLTTPWAARCLSNRLDERWAWYNPPWGPRYTACAPGCTSKVCARRGWHQLDTFPGTRHFTPRAISQSFAPAIEGIPPLSGVVVLVPTASDTSWWRELFAAAADVRLLPRIAFHDADTGIAATSPPGGGCTLFELRKRIDPRHADLVARVYLADQYGRTEHELVG